MDTKQSQNKMMLVIMTKTLQLGKETTKTERPTFC